VVVNPFVSIGICIILIVVYLDSYYNLKPAVKWIQKNKVHMRFIGAWVCIFIPMILLYFNKCNGYTFFIPFAFGMGLLLTTVSKEIDKK
jgi:hypothetical protein